jgi:hypothetical protein
MTAAISDAPLTVTTLPTVSVWPDIEKRFGKAREVAADRNRGKQLVIVTKQRSFMLVGCPAPETFSPPVIAAIEKIVPSATPLHITVIANNDPEAIQSDVLKVIPFAAYLLGLVHMGHSVILFEGHSSGLVAAVRDADLLLVDGAMSSTLPHNWVNIAKAVMRQRWIIEFGRDGKLTDLAKPARLKS